MRPLSASNTTNCPTKEVDKESDYWNEFYTAWDLDSPSPFCVWVAQQADTSNPLVEFGCGNGRDACYFACNGFTVWAGDISEEAIHRNRAKKLSPKARFDVCDVAQAQHVADLIRKARGCRGNNLSLYSRFFLHSLDASQEKKFLAALTDHSCPGDCLYL